MENNIDLFSKSIKKHLETVEKPDIRKVALDIALMINEIPDEDMDKFKRIVDKLLKEQEEKQNAIE